MARARNIKPGFFANEELVELSFGTRLLFIGLWTIADRSGRLEDRPKRIKMALFPADNIDVDAALEELRQSKFILRYEADGERYIQVIAFEKHQNPHRDEKASLIPAPNEHGASMVQAWCKQDGNRADSLIPDSPIPSTPNPDSQIKPPAPVGADGDPKFCEAWDAYPNRPGASKAGALKAWKARIKAKADPDEIIAGVRRYARYVEATGTEPQFVKQPATFFGPDEHWKSDWTAQPRASPYQSKTDKAKQWTDQITGRTSNDQPEFIDIN